MNKDFKINLKAKQSNKLILKILTIFALFSYLLLSIQNNEIFKYLYENKRSSVVQNINVVYYLAVLLFGVLSYYAMKYELDNNADNIKLLINLGLKRSQLYKILLRSINLEIFMGYIIGLPLGILFAEIVDLLSILILDLDISIHKINIDPKAIGLSFVLLFSFVLISLFIIVLKVGKKYQEKTNGVKSYALIVQLLFIIAFIYNLSYNYFLNFKIIILLLSLDAIIVFVLSKLIKGSNSYNYENSLLLSHIDQGKVIFLFILIALTTSLSNLYRSVSEINYVMTDSKSRPHFTVFEDGEVINQLQDDYIDVISDLYPINIMNYKGIDDSGFKYAILKVVDIKNNYPIKTPSIMDYSTYKNIYRDRSFDLNNKDETIYLYSNQIDRTSFGILNKYLEGNQSIIKIDGKDFKVKAVDRSDIIFANNVYTESFIYVIQDEMFKKLVDDYNPIAYNIDISDEYLNKYGKNDALEIIRSEFFNRNIKFESLIWMIKNNYGSILSRQFILIHISILLVLIAGLFLAINMMSFFNNKSSDFNILSLIGNTDNTLKDLKKSHKIKVYGLVITLSLVNYTCYIYFIESSTPDKLYTSTSLFLGTFYIVIPLILILLILITGRLVLTKDTNYE